MTRGLIQLVRQRRAEPAGADWLFPGAVAGRPLNVEQMTRRLNTIGVQVRAARNTTMMDLAGDVPAVVLSQLLGLHVRTTTDWARVAGTPGAEYAADVSRRKPNSPS
jgi:L-alanine-DL-glutamate epimerase-like enolase superfamily enzyme